MDIYIYIYTYIYFAHCLYYIPYICRLQPVYFCVNTPIWSHIYGPSYLTIYALMCRVLGTRCLHAEVPVHLCIYTPIPPACLCACLITGPYALYKGHKGILIHLCINVCIYIYIYTYTYMHIYIFILCVCMVVL